MSSAGSYRSGSLKRRLMVQLGLMIIGLLLLGTAAVVGINGLHHDYGIALRGYQQLRVVYEIGQATTSARAALTREPADRAAAREAFQSAILRASTSRELSEVTELRASVENASKQMTSDSMDAVLGEVAQMSAQIRRTVTAAQEAGERKRQLTLIAVTGLSILVTAGGIVIGIQQYRAVMNPLHRLGHAVREVAKGRFTKPIEESGDREFLELAGDFNRMASELEALYRDLEQKVRDKSKELVRSERLASVGYLAAGVAHEINNPLSIITGYGERALRQLDAEGPGPQSLRARKAIEVMCEEAFRCKQITDRLLSLARGGSETFGPVDLAKIAEEVIANLTALPEYGDRGIGLEADHRAPLRVRGREGEIKQVILNLLINALQASNPSPGTPGKDQNSSSDSCIAEALSPNPVPKCRKGETKVSIVRIGDQVEFTVHDRGRGMNAATLDRVFEPFFTTQRGNTRGTGLGLSISHAIVTDHGGTITAYSDGPGRGSRFVIRLPALEETIHVQS